MKYRTVVRLLTDGKVRAVGVSNLMPNHLARLLDATSIVPAGNEVEVHPSLRQVRAVAGDLLPGLLVRSDALQQLLVRV